MDAIMICPSCGNEIPAGTLFCGACGALIPSAGSDESCKTVAADQYDSGKTVAADQYDSGKTVAADQYDSVNTVAADYGAQSYGADSYTPDAGGYGAQDYNSGSNTYGADNGYGYNDYSAPSYDSAPQKKNTAKIAVIGGIAVAIIAAVVICIIVFAGGGGDSDGGDSGGGSPSGRAAQIQGTWHLNNEDYKAFTVSFSGGKCTVGYQDKSQSDDYSVDGDTLDIGGTKFTYADVDESELTGMLSPLESNQWYVSDDYLVVGTSVYVK